MDANARHSRPKGAATFWSHALTFRSIITSRSLIQGGRFATSRAAKILPDLKLARWIDNKRASVAVTAAVMLTSLLFFSGLTIDLGLALVKKRALQAATDAAAMAAAQNPSNAMAIATDMLAANGFASARITSLTTGNYTANPEVPPSGRYIAGMAPVNAVQIATTYDSPLSFVKAITQRAVLTVPAASAGAQTAEASLTAGTGLTSLSGGLPNAILSGLTASQISLDIASYNGLSNVNINALDFLNALAAQMNITAGTYSQVLSGTASLGNIVQAEISALSKEGSIGSAQLNAVGALNTLYVQLNGSLPVSVGSLISAGVWRTAQIGSVDPASAVQASLNVYDLLSFAAQVANGSNLISEKQALVLPGIATVDVTLATIEPAQSAYYAIGTNGTSVHTSQIRLLLNFSLLNVLQILGMGAPIALQIYVEVGSGTAALTNISCGASPAADTRVGVQASSSLASAYVGTVLPASAISNFTQAVTVQPSTIVNLAGIEQITGSAVVSTQGAAQKLTFSQTQIQTQTAQTVSNTNMLSNLLSTLQTSLILKSNPVPLLAVQPLLTPLLTPVFAALDGVAAQVLSTLGVRVGYLDVTVTGTRCGIPGLVQ